MSQKLDRKTKQRVYELLATFYESYGRASQYELINLATDVFGEPFNPETLRAARKRLGK